MKPFINRFAVYSGGKRLSLQMSYETRPHLPLQWTICWPLVRSIMVRAVAAGGVAGSAASLSSARDGYVFEKVQFEGLDF